MRTAVDTNVFSEIASEGRHKTAARRLLLQCAQQGSIVVCPAVYAEMLANPGLSFAGVDAMLEGIGATVDLVLDIRVWREAGRGYRDYVRARRRSGGGDSRRLLADFVIGAHALLMAEQLLTFDTGTYASYFPELKLIGTKLP